jgi:GT2 family glycosyltransferase
MTTLSALTLVRNRETHLKRLVEGLARSGRPPDELIVVDMSDAPIATPQFDGPVTVDRLAGAALPLAAARNRAASLATGELLLFLDVDCIPSSGVCERVERVLEIEDVAACPEVLYLPEGSLTERPWDEAGLKAAGRPHPVRPFPSSGQRAETNAGLFWSLAFAVRRSTFQRIGGFDEGYVGYGAEDTDLGFRMAEAGLPLIFLGGAPVFHQHHEGFDPPLQHFRALIANANRFHAHWSIWPMDGWLAAMARMGLVDWSEQALTIVRDPTADEIRSARKSASDPF